MEKKLTKVKSLNKISLYNFLVKCENKLEFTKVFKLIQNLAILDYVYIFEENLTFQFEIIPFSELFNFLTKLNKI